MATRPPTAPVRDLHVGSARRVSDLVADFGRMGGFSSRKIAQAVAILRRMRRERAKVLLSFPADLVATGLRGVLVDLVRGGYVHGIITASGTLDHDLARTWGNYHHGAFEMDDRALEKRGIHRLGNVLVPRRAYGDLLERRLRPFLRGVFSDDPTISTMELCRRLGQLLERDRRRADSLLWHAYRKKVPIFVPGPTDGAVGSQIWLAYQANRKIRLDLMADEQALSDLAAGARRLGALVLGGGISKHHLLWWSQFRGGLDYAVAVTTAPEYDGSLSGARLREAISWGKLKRQADHVTIDGDATVILPLLVAGWW